MSKKAILGIIGVIAIAAVAGGYYVANKPPASVGKALFTVQAAALISDFEQDETAANEKYLDKVIAVKGTVKEVLEQDNAFILLVGDDTSMGSVSCTLSADHESVAYGLTAGDQVSVKGRCTGYLMDVVLIDCVLLNDQ